MLYTDCPDGRTDAVARHVSFAQITQITVVGFQWFYYRDDMICQTWWNGWRQRGGRRGSLSPLLCPWPFSLPQGKSLMVIKCPLVVAIYMPRCDCFSSSSSWSFISIDGWMLNGLSLSTILHISRADCTEITKDRPEQIAYETFI